MNDKLLTQHSNGQLSVYFDGLCPLCSHEIEIYRRKDIDGQIRFVDIADPRFDAKSEGLDPEHVHKKFHVKTPDGQLVEGVSAFVEIWKHLDIWYPLQALAGSRLSRPLLDIGYNVFAKVRPFLRRNPCETDYCTTKEGA